MTDFIHGEALLEEAEINRIIESAPSDLVAFRSAPRSNPSKLANRCDLARAVPRTGDPPCLTCLFNPHLRRLKGSPL